MEERLRFIARLLDGEKMAGLCREFGISRKTGYKVYDRYKDCGLDGLTDRSRRPYRHANQLPMQVEKLIVRLKQEYPRWGGRDPRETQAAVSRPPVPRHKHGPRGSRPPWPRAASPPPALQGAGHGAVSTHDAQRVLVC